MTDSRGTIREIVWQDLCPWLIILRTFRLAISFRVLVLAAAALVGVTAGWRVVGKIYSESEDAQVQALIEDLGAWPWNENNYTIDVPDAISPDRTDTSIASVPAIGQWLRGGPVVRAWRHITAPFLALFDSELSITGLTYLLLCCLWSVVVWGLFGGAITRIAALDLARDESLGIVAAVHYSSGRWLAYFLSPILPLVGILFVVVPLMVLGWLVRVDYFVLVGGLLWPLVLVAGLFMAIILIGLAAGWPLMLPTISSEGTDAFDALSRSYAYVYQRPLHYLFYALIASLLGIVGVLVVDIFADAIVGLGAWGVSWGAGADRIGDIAGAGDEASMLLKSGSALVGFWIGCVTTLKVGFRFGFFWTAASAIYLLLRHNVDATEMDEVALEEQEEAHGLPPLANDKSGIPGVADDES